MKKIFAVIAAIGVIGTGGTVMAGDAKPAKVAEPAAVVEAKKVQQMQIFTGTVLKHEKQIVLSTGGKTYLLGGAELEKIVGKKVSISGTLVKGKSVDTIIVEQAEIIG